MTTFLPEDYEAPSDSENYMKFAQGENKLRILSAPILGWEDWTADKKPLRFHYNSKPSQPINPARPVKHFWAMIVWNYSEERIQILQIRQASIRGAIEALSKNEDWGAPYFYDIKITQKGKSVDTKYNVTPVSHKPTSEAIRKAFADRPINLDALFDNSDPFAITDKGFTPGIFENAQAPKDPTLSPTQQAEIIELVKDDDDIQQRMLDGYGKTSLEEIPAKHFAAIISNLKKRKAS